MRDRFCLQFFRLIELGNIDKLFDVFINPHPALAAVRANANLCGYRAIHAQDGVVKLGDSFSLSFDIMTYLERNGSDLR